MSESRVRLIKSDQSYVPIGTCGTLLNYEDQFYCIFWDTKKIEFRTSLESDDYFVDFIIQGYSFLTMDDVFCIASQKMDKIDRIDDQKLKHEIIKEFQSFIQPLIQKGLRKKYTLKI